MSPAFQPFDARTDFRATNRNLPHWHQSGATYFVTFRLADSLPKEVRERFSEMLRLNDSDRFAWMEGYLDAGSGKCLLANPNHAKIVASTLLHFDGKHYTLGSFAVMPNHVHVLVQPITPATLTSVLHSWKSYTANRLQRDAAVQGQVWQEESFDRIVRDETELKKFTDYILNNPLVAHLPPDSFVIGNGSARWVAS